MSIVRGMCLACGVALDLTAADPFAGAGLAAPICPACSDCRFLDGGGAILELQRDLIGSRFPLGKVSITGGAVAALADTAQHAVEFLARHVRGDCPRCASADPQGVVLDVPLHDFVDGLALHRPHVLPPATVQNWNSRRRPSA